MTVLALLWIAVDARAALVVAGVGISGLLTNVSLAVAYAADGSPLPVGGLAETAAPTLILLAAAIVGRRRALN